MLLVMGSSLFSQTFSSLIESQQISISSNKTNPKIVGWQIEVWEILQYSLGNYIKKQAKTENWQKFVQISVEWRS